MCHKKDIVVALHGMNCSNKRFPQFTTPSSRRKMESEWGISGNKETTKPGWETLEFSPGGYLGIKVAKSKEQYRLNQLGEVREAAPWGNHHFYSTERQAGCPYRPCYVTVMSLTYYHTETDIYEDWGFREARQVPAVRKSTYTLDSRPISNKGSVLEEGGAIRQTVPKEPRSGP